MFKFILFFWSIGVWANPVLVIGIAGASGAGKTQLAETIARHVNSDDLAILSQDAYFKDWASLPAEHFIDGEPNGDHPSALRFDEMIHDIESIKQGEPTQIPRYDFVSNKSMPDGPMIHPVKVLLVEGLHTLWNPRLRKLLDYTFFVRADADVRLSRRLRRDSAERNVPMDEGLNYYFRAVRPMQTQFIDPTVVFADREVDGEEPDAVALDASAEIVRYLQRVRKNNPAFFYDREIKTFSSAEKPFRGETIPQLVLQQGSNAVLIEGGSLRPPTIAHLGLVIQTMERFGITNGKLLPANAYKPGSINNAAALHLTRVAVKNFNEALDTFNVRYTNFMYTPQTGARWEGMDQRSYRVQVDTTEMEIRNPVVDNEDFRTLMAFEELKQKAGGDPKSIFWLAGGDSFASLPTWNKRWAEHLDLANWIIVSRPEFVDKNNNVSFETTDPLNSHLAPDIRARYNYYFDHTTQTHVYENIDPQKPNLYVVRFSNGGLISSTSARKSLAKGGDDSLVARVGLTNSVYEASLSLRLFENKDCPVALASPSIGSE